MAARAARGGTDLPGDEPFGDPPPRSRFDEPDDPEAYEDAYRQAREDAEAEHRERETRAKSGSSGRARNHRRPPRSPRRPRSPGKPSLRRPLGRNIAIGAGTGLAGLFLGAVIYAVLLSVVEYGSAGPGMWFRAKFMDQVGGSSTSGGPPVGPGGFQGGTGPYVPGQAPGGLGGPYIGPGPSGQGYQGPGPA